MRAVRRTSLNIPRAKTLLLGLSQSQIDEPRGVLQEIIDVMNHSRKTYSRPDATAQDVIDALGYERNKQRTGRKDESEALLDEVNDALNYLDLMIQGRRPPLDIWRARLPETDRLSDS